MPHRRTFTPATTNPPAADRCPASALSEASALRHPWLRWPPTPAPGAWATPPGSECECRRQRLSVVPCFALHAAAPAAATVARRCDRLPGWSHLGCDHAGPSPPGAWMGSFSRRRIPSGLLRLTRGSPGGRAIAGRGTPRLCLRPAKAAGAMDGLVFAPTHPFGPASAYARLAWRASHRRSRHTSAVPPTCQGCRGHGWPGSRKVRSSRCELPG
jgi:hypothetical protein